MSADKPDDTRTHESDFAAMWSSDGATRSFSPTASATGLPADLPFLLSDGQRFGPYLIVRPLGKGGMGQVYEAEEIDSGRRVAMKILSRGLGDDEERERFLREGQLAASLSHPHTVYVFGTTEVQGFPVIAMELAPGGTLKDLLVDGKPLPPAAAVDAILQVVAGLDAAAAIGILHRDIKPSNCFVDCAGRVLVGDFGLSMTTLARDEATLEVAGTIMGTPGFASPEQLRGESLDVRSDIYSVGATLYYLLTGRPPFDDKNIATLVTRVGSEAPPVVSVFRPDVSPRLAALVARCLSKAPGDRYVSYPALASALEPFRTAAHTPAPLGRRFLAGFVDSYAATLPLMPLNVFLGTRLLSLEHRGEAALLALPTMVASLLYYCIAEGRFGCGAGKAALNLRVIDAAQSAPGYRRALLRAFVFIAPAQIVTQAFGYLVMRWSAAARGPGGLADPGDLTMGFMALGSVLLSYACVALLFSRARRGNGYAAFHDLASGTRVVLRPKRIEARQASRGAPAAGSKAIAGDTRIGPYVVPPAVRAQVSAVTASMTIDAYDDRLRRGVWLELLPAGSAPLPAERRDLGRPARARWLSGRRSETECWDAYEAVDGQPFLQAIAQPQPWSRVRHWMADCAQEIAHGLKDGLLPALHADRVWIGSDDRARLLDWPPPSPADTRLASARQGLSSSPADTRLASARQGLSSSPADTRLASARQGPALTAPASAGLRASAPATAPDSASAQQFLYGLAAGALRGVHPEVAGQEPPSTPIPAPARKMLLSLRDAAFGSAGAIEEQASAMLRDPGVFPRSRRLLQLAVCALIPIVMTIAVIGAIKWQVLAQTGSRPAYELDVCLKQLVTLDRKSPGKLTAADLQQRDAIEVYIAEHLRDAAGEKAAYARAFPAATSAQLEYAKAVRALGSHPQRSPEQVRNADTVVAKLLADNAEGLSQVNQPVVLWAVVAFIAGGAAAVVAVIGLVGAFAARGGFTLRAFGAALVIADGRDASRLRALLRALVAWSPLALWLAIVKWGPEVRSATALHALLYSIPAALLLAGAAWAWRHPSRGIQDRIAGTWIVPR